MIGKDLFTMGCAWKSTIGGHNVGADDSPVYNVGSSCVEYCE